MKMSCSREEGGRGGGERGGGGGERGGGGGRDRKAHDTNDALLMTRKLMGVDFE